VSPQHQQFPQHQVLGQYQRSHIQSQAQQAHNPNTNANASIPQIALTIPNNTTNTSASISIPSNDPNSIAFISQLLSQKTSNINQCPQQSTSQNLSPTNPIMPPHHQTYPHGNQMSLQEQHASPNGPMHMNQASPSSLLQQTLLIDFSHLMQDLKSFDKGETNLASASFESPSPSNHMPTHKTTNPIPTPLSSLSFPSSPSSFPSSPSSPCSK